MYREGILYLSKNISIMQTENEDHMGDIISSLSSSSLASFTSPMLACRVPPALSLRLINSSHIASFSSRVFRPMAKQSLSPRNVMLVVLAFVAPGLAMLPLPSNELDRMRLGGFCPKPKRPASPSRESPPAVRGLFSFRIDGETRGPIASSAAVPVRGRRGSFFLSELRFLRGAGEDMETGA